jgi:Fic family protein
MPSWGRFSWLSFSPRRKNHNITTLFLHLSYNYVMITYKVKENTNMDLLEIQTLAKKKFDIKNITEEFIIKLIHTSLSFESDRITAEEVKNIITNNLANIEEFKIKLVHNHHKAFLFIIDLVKENKEFGEETLKDIHETLMEGFGIGGLYRTVNLFIKGSEHTPPAWEKVRDRMTTYFEKLSEAEPADPFEIIAYSHLQLAKIHPFLDGNGRCARLVLNYNLMKRGFAPIIIPYTEKTKYFQTLESYKVLKDPTPFIEFIKELEVEYLNK